MGRITGRVHLISTVADVANIAPSDPERLAFVTQTTLSVDDTRDIIAALKARFPAIVGPDTRDICYATQNRQTAAKEIARLADMVIVIGSPASSNSVRLVETALAAGAPRAELVDNPRVFDMQRLAGVARLGLTSGASAPEELTEHFLARLAAAFNLSVRTVETARESVVFKQPLTAAA
jgi:4-hydroxy-3-methylbut-2-enyl diphosphate reductase